MVHVMTSLEPGGLENGVVNIANSLDHERFRTSIVCLERVGAFRQRLKPNVEVTCLEKGPGFQWSAVRRLADLLEAKEADLIHSHNLGPLTYGVLAKGVSRRRLVVVQGEHAELRPDEKTAKRRWMRKLGYLGCRHIHAVSGGLREELIRFGLPKEKIRTILNGVDCERFHPLPYQERRIHKRDLGFAEDTVVVGVVGRFGEFKGHLRLLGAFDRLGASTPNLGLLVVGDHGPMKGAVMNRIDASPFCDRIRWVGFQDDPSPFYQAMDILAIPSENEGLSNAMLEAMSTGVPCLANSACGASEVIEDGKNGFLGKLAKEQELEEALRKTLGDSSFLIEAGREARHRAVSAFSLDVMVGAYARLYEDALATSR